MYGIKNTLCLHSFFLALMLLYPSLDVVIYLCNHQIFLYEILSRSALVLGIVMGLQFFSCVMRSGVSIV